MPANPIPIFGDSPAERSTNAVLEALLKHAPIGCALVDTSFRFVRVNEVMARSHALSAAEHIGKTVQEVIPALWPVVGPLYARALRGETILNHDVDGPLNGGQHHWLVSYYPVQLQGEVIGVGVIVNEITGRRRAEEALGIRNDLYAMLSATSRAVCLCRNREELFNQLCALAVETGRFQFAWVGVPEDGRIVPMASAGEDAGYMKDLVVTVSESDPRSRGPTGSAWRTGTHFVVNDFMASAATAPWHAAARRVGFAASAAFPLLERGKVVAVLTLYATVPAFFTDELIATLTEITPSVSLALDRFVLEQERIQQEAELHLRDRAIQAVSQGIVITDASAPDNPVIFVSPGFERMTGYSSREAVGRNCRFLQGSGTDAMATAKLKAAVMEGRAETVEVLNYRKDGSSFWNNVALSPIRDERDRVTHFVGVQTDVTERRTLESQFRQAQKMEAVGQLAAGVAHDFNNILSVILSYSHLIEKALPAGDPLRHDVEEIRRAGERATGLTRQLLAFSRRQLLQPRVLNIHHTIGGMEKMLKRLLGEDVELSLFSSPTLGRAYADPSQLEQIVMNIAVNARDAMPRGGRFRIETANADLDAHFQEIHLGAVPGPYVMMEFSDDGVGMDSATRERIFEPFFTTKEQGKGTGLGLSTVFGIVKQSQGHISVESEPGRGTTFRVYLPRVPQPAEAENPPLAPTERPRGHETILLVEDDEQVRSIAAIILRRQGYVVLDAQNGGEALLICEEFPETIHLLLTDVIMPRMSGRQLAKRIQARRPEAKVLFMSGYPESSIGEHHVLGPETAYFQKPITPVALLNKVREVLGGGKAALAGE